MEIKNISISEIAPYAKNAKKHPKEQIANIAKSIERFGWKQPVVIDRNGVIVIGHGRVEAAKKLKLKEVPCVVVEDLSEEETRMLRLTDNKLNESDWDMDLLADDLEGLNWGDMQLDWGLPIQELEVVEDNYEPNPPDEPKAKRGDIYSLGRHRLMCGDSTSLEDVQLLVGGGQMDMLLTDPPYNVDYKGTAGEIANDNMEDSDFRSFLVAAFLSAKSVMKPGAAFHIWHADSEGYNFRGACRDAGLEVRQCLIWVKNSLVLGWQDFQWKHEPCLYGEKPVEAYSDEYETDLYGWKDGGPHKWYKNRRQTTILEFDRPTSSKEHPTMKPIKLFDYEMQCNSKPDDCILDLFSGSGTTIMAAEQNGRMRFAWSLTQNLLM